MKGGERGGRLDVGYDARKPWVPSAAALKRWASAAVPPDVTAWNLSIRIVGTARSRRLNERYRHKAKPTNVLSFQGAGADDTGCRWLGELVICAPVMAREAREQGKRAEAHWAHIAVHGVLHLLGYDHERAADAQIMESREAQILEKMGFSHPYR